MAVVAQTLQALAEADSEAELNAAIFAGISALIDSPDLILCEVVAGANVQLFSLEPGRSTPAAAAAEPGPPVAAAERHSVR